MKKLDIFTGIFLLGGILLMTSCEHQGRIKEKTVLNKVTERLKEDLNKDNYSKRLVIGYYEENDDDQRFELRKLAAAGVITYKVERIKKSVSYHSGYKIDWYNYNVVNEYKRTTKNIYFVDVALTEQGQACSLGDIPAYEGKIDEYLKPAIIGHYPEFDVSPNEYFPEDEKEEAAKPAASKEEKPASKPQKEEPKSDYDKAKALEHKESVLVKTYSLNAVKAKNIVVREGNAQCECIFEAFDVTPFGRIYNKVYDGTHTAGKASFVYTQDEGWLLTEWKLYDFFI